MTPDERKKRRRAANARYAKSDKGKARLRQYQRSEQGQYRALAQLLKRCFGLTPEQYTKMLVMQNGVCAVCGLPSNGKRLGVDHDHTTGRVRCLSCDPCNRLLLSSHTIASARRVLEILESDFDGRKL